MKPSEINMQSTINDCINNDCESPVAKSQIIMVLSIKPLTSCLDLSPSWRRQVTLLLRPLRVVSLSKGVEGSLEEGRLMTDNDQSDFNTWDSSHQIPDYYYLVIAPAGEAAIIKQD